MLVKIRPELAAAGLDIGRDKFFALLRSRELLVPAPRRTRRTTWAGQQRFPNLLAVAELTAPQQAWVGDITYLETEQGFCYLSLLTDAYSRYIVGFDVSKSLAADSAQRALSRAIAQAKPPLTGLIHHSDHGSQYTSAAYCKLLHQAGIRASMGAVGNCYDNALAERMNGILKLEYALDSRFLDYQQACTATVEAVWLYNHERPHLALHYQTPVPVQQQRHH